VIFLGRSGTGKTHLAIALASSLWSRGEDPVYHGCGLVNELIEARDDKRLTGS
jgi:DNA replication protein DnaC